MGGEYFGLIWLSSKLHQALAIGAESQEIMKGEIILVLRSYIQIGLNNVFYLGGGGGRNIFIFYFIFCLVCYYYCLKL